MAIWQRTDNWLVGIAESDHPNHSIRGNLGDLTAEMVQATFDVTYGKGRYKATNHGSVITVWSHIGMVRKLEAQRACLAEHSAPESRFTGIDQMLEKYRAKAEGEDA